MGNPNSFDISILQAVMTPGLSELPLINKQGVPLALND
jgi:hypothetical protein